MKEPTETLVFPSTTLFVEMVYARQEKTVEIARKIAARIVEMEYVILEKLVNTVQIVAEVLCVEMGYVISKQYCFL